MAEIIPCYRPQGKPCYAFENTHRFMIDFGLPALIFAFSLFFSLLPGKANARMVRAGLRGAPPVLSNNINDLIEIDNPEVSGV